MTRTNSAQVLLELAHPHEWRRNRTVWYATAGEQVAAFPIDEERLTVTFGRDLTCSVRLYYPEIDALHAEIVVLERKMHGLFAYIH
ncbi:hypothetical protein EV702DRAFT_1092941 [Suillus placidus]|uniref:Uncharacterized protein n=1 Tax=Suillus placidus TaxID=48579 RepID=A0A9P6ZXZ2_9AGAM|nr:hypothetical protein EV702DRAFT_1092941 [Suillus placidus]